MKLRKSKDNLEFDWDDVEKQIVEQQKTIDYDTKEFTVELLVEKFKKGDFFVPLYQRNFVWSHRRQSRFIESVLLGLPIPYMFMADTQDGRLEIVDGAQRMNTLASYLKGELTLKDLEILTVINKLKFNDIPLSQQRKFKNRSLRMVVLNDRTTEDAKFSIFERINTGSDTLKHSELRKGAYSGPFYSLVDELAKEKEFVALCPVTDKLAKRGERQELILRYLAYSERYSDFQHDVGEFLNTYIKEKNAQFRNNQNLGKKERGEKRAAFLRMLEFVRDWLPDGFAKSSKAKTTPRVRFEAISVGVNLALQKNPTLVPASMSWLTSDDFKRHTTTHGSNSSIRLKGRIEFVRDALLS